MSRMMNSRGSGGRMNGPVRTVSAVGLAAFAGAAMLPVDAAWGVDKWWNVASGNWGTGANWFTAGVPMNADNVFIGNTLAAENASVQLNVVATVASLSITDGMKLDTNVSKLTVTGATTISGRNLIGDNLISMSTLNVENGPAAADLQAGAITISDGATIELEDGATALVGGLLNLGADSSIYGSGTILLTSNSPVAMRVDGNLQAGVSASGMTISQLGTGLIDLDGTVADGENSYLNITGAMIDDSAFASLTIDGMTLADPFDDMILLGGGNTLTMNLTNGWAIGSVGVLRFITSEGKVPLLEGAELTLRGKIRLLSQDQDAVLDCPMIFDTGARVELGLGSEVFCMQSVSVRDCTATLPTGSRLIFNGATEWDGTFEATGDGQLFTHGNCTVTGPTVIDVSRIKLDGSGFTVWNVQDSLTINTDAIDPLLLPTANRFDGTMNVFGPASARCSINLNSPSDLWTMVGTMNLVAPVGPATTRLGGSLFAIEGDLNVTGSVRTDAGYGLFPGSVTTLSGATDTFENSSSAMVSAGASFLGTGSFVCGSTGSMRLMDGAALGSTGLVNRGDLEINFGTGEASVGRFTQFATGEYHVDIGGTTPGTRHDHLVVAGLTPAVLGGMVQVDLVDAGDGPFTPMIGQMFTILTSRAGLSGVFAGVSPTERNGVLYVWSLVYDATTVRVRLDSIIVRCPADFNGDGFVDGFDYDDFVACFEGEACPIGKSADFNGDGFPDGFDYDDFVTAFEEGC